MDYNTVVQPSLASTAHVVSPTGAPNWWDGFTTTVIGAGKTILSRKIDEQFPEAAQPDVDENRDTANNALEIVKSINPLYYAGGALLLVAVAVVAYKVID